MLQLPTDLHKRLSEELRLAVTKMEAAQSAQEKLYYFSVVFGEAVRVLNWHWDKDLVLIWAVAQHTHTAISSRLASIAQGEPVIRLEEEFFDALTRQTSLLVTWIERQGDNSELCQILGGLTQLIYATTGNGFYLLGKEHFTLES